uniref:Uncharacterized protein n=2 Tax=Aegilops tauschii subsp. strangulata TaxID=200361 RepID=A0A453P332_AEGTS
SLRCGNAHCSRLPRRSKKNLFNNPIKKKNRRHLAVAEECPAVRMPSPPPSLSSLCRRLCFLLTILFMLSSARRCASFAASIRCFSWYCASTPPPSVPRSSLEEEARALSVGDELVGETIPLRYGRRLYRLAGLRPPAWYEIKISYPTSIPSSFSIRLVNDPNAVEDLGSKNRRLLNTEKILFKAESTRPVGIQ